MKKFFEIIYEKQFASPTKIKMKSQFIVRITVILLIFLIKGFFLQTDILARKNDPLDLRKNLKLIETIDLSGNKFRQVLFTEIGELFITMSNPVTGEWIYQIGNMRRSYSPCGNKEDSSGVFNSNKKLFVISCPDFSVEIWDLETAKRILHFRIPKDKKDEYTKSLFPYLSPNGKRIILKTSMLGEEAELWDAEEGGKITVFNSSATRCFSCNRTVYRTVFSPDSRKVAVSHGGMVFLWNAATGELLHRLMDEKVRLYSSDPLSHNGVVSEILFSRDSKTIITGSYDGIVKSWGVETGRLINVFKGHKDRIESLALSPDGKILATGSRDERVKLWDLESGKLLITSGTNKGDVWSLDFSPDGKKILSMTEGRTFIWETATGKLLEQMSDIGLANAKFSSNWQFVFVFNRKKNTIWLYEYKGNTERIGNAL
jgi:WD40 repeat protein